MFRFLPILALAAPLALAVPECSVGTWMNSDKSKCFEVVTVPMDFQSAKEICAGFGGVLASVDNAADNKLVDKDIRISGGDAWLGAEVKNGKWSWLNGKPMSYVHWAKNEPKPGAKCASINAASGKWVAVKCDSKLHYVCESAIVQAH